MAGWAGEATGTAAEEGEAAGKEAAAVPEEARKTAFSAGARAEKAAGEVVADWEAGVGAGTGMAAEAAAREGVADSEAAEAAPVVACRTRRRAWHNCSCVRDMNAAWFLTQKLCCLLHAGHTRPTTTCLSSVHTAAFTMMLTACRL